MIYPTEDRHLSMASVAPKSTLTLTTIPQELIIHILSFLDFRNMLMCCATCRFLQNILHENVKLQYVAELDGAGMVDTGSRLPSSHLLKMLRNHRRAWDDLMWSNFKSVTLQGEVLAYELVSGVFCKTNRDHLTTCTLPSALYGVAEPLVSVVQLNIPGVKDFAMDPTQDLIVFVQDEDMFAPAANGRTITVHIRNMSNGNTHPSAARPFFPMRLDSGNGHSMRTVVVQIVEDVVAMYLWISEADGDRLIGWNWKTGGLLFDMDKLPEDSHDFNLISRTAFVVTTKEDSGRLNLYKFSPDSLLPKVVLVARLHLPSTRRDIRTVSLIIHSGPYAADNMPEQLFTSSRENFIHAVQILYDWPQRLHPQSYRFYVHNRVFIDLLESSSGDIDVPFEKWGTMHTRMFASEGTYNWMRYVHGYRVVFPAGGPTITILDFSPSAVRAAKGPCIPTVVRKNEIFENDVVTELPYNQITKPHMYSALDPRSVTGFMIDQERILVFRSSSSMREVNLDVIPLNDDSQDCVVGLAQLHM